MFEAVGVVAVSGIYMIYPTQLSGIYQCNSCIVIAHAYPSQVRVWFLKTFSVRPKSYIYRSNCSSRSCCMYSYLFICLALDKPVMTQSALIIVM